MFVAGHGLTDPLPPDHSRHSWTMKDALGQAIPGWNRPKLRRPARQLPYTPRRSRQAIAIKDASEPSAAPNTRTLLDPQ